jgi:hypothetical protein
MALSSPTPLCTLAAYDSVSSSVSIAPLNLPDVAAYLSPVDTPDRPEPTCKRPAIIPPIKRRRGHGSGQSLHGAARGILLRAAGLEMAGPRTTILFLATVVAKPSGGPHAVEQARLDWLRWTCLMKRERVAAPAGAGTSRRQESGASFRYFSRAAW